jgi:hypothetical protein
MPTNRGRILIIVIRGLFPTQVVVVVNCEAAISVLPLALFGLLFRVCSEIVFRQVVRQRHAWARVDGSVAV